MKISQVLIFERSTWAAPHKLS